MNITSAGNTHGDRHENPVVPGVTERTMALTPRPSGLRSAPGRRRAVARFADESSARGLGLGEAVARALANHDVAERTRYRLRVRSGALFDTLRFAAWSFAYYVALLAFVFVYTSTDFDLFAWLLTGEVTFFVLVLSVVGQRAYTTRNAAELAARTTFLLVATLVSMTREIDAAKRPGRRGGAGRWWAVRAKNHTGALSGYRRSLARNAWVLARRRAQVAGRSKEAAFESAFATESRVFLWCAEDPANRIGRALALAGVLISRLDVYEPRPVATVRLGWLDPEVFASLPVLYEGGRKHSERKLLEVVRSPSFAAAIVGAAVTLTAALIKKGP